MNTTLRDVQLQELNQPWGSNAPQHPVVLS